VKLCKEYLNTATFKISVKDRTFWYTDRLPTSSYTGVIRFKNVQFLLGHPVYILFKCTVQLEGV